jgi:hypothetical protein
MSLNYIDIHQFSDLSVVINSLIFLAHHKTIKDDETATNMWCISFEDTLLRTLSKKKFETFINTLINHRKEQLALMYKSQPATFYMWFDEMAEQLRFNLISGHVAQLPFGCIVKIVDSIDPIWQDLKSCRNNGISWSELEFFEDEENDTSDQEAYILKVYVQYL